jgi:hypothetical protein
MIHGDDCFSYFNKIGRIPKMANANIRPNTKHTTGRPGSLEAANG